MPPRSKQKSLALLARLQRRVASLQKDSYRLDLILPLYLSVPQQGTDGLMRYGWALAELEKTLLAFPDDNKKVGSR